MKALALIILSMIFPLLAMNQDQQCQFPKLKTLDGTTVDLQDIFRENNLTIVYFFKENSRNTMDQLDYMESLAQKYSDINLKIIAVCNASNGCFSHIRPFILGNDIGLETLIDVNGEFQRAMGLPVNSTMVFTRYSDLLSGQCSEMVSYSPEQAEMELMQLLSNDNSITYNDPYEMDNRYRD